MASGSFPSTSGGTGAAPLVPPYPPFCLQARSGGYHVPVSSLTFEPSALTAYVRLLKGEYAVSLKKGLSSTSKKNLSGSFMGESSGNSIGDSRGEVKEKEQFQTAPKPWEMTLSQMVGHAQARNLAKISEYEKELEAMGRSALRIQGNLRRDSPGATSGAMIFLPGRSRAFGKSTRILKHPMDWPALGSFIGSKCAGL